MTNMPIIIFAVFDMQYMKSKPDEIDRLTDKTDLTTDSRVS